jgi:hypothetical protein
VHLLCQPCPIWGTLATLTPPPATWRSVIHSVTCYRRTARRRSNRPIQNRRPLCFGQMLGLRSSAASRSGQRPRERRSRGHDNRRQGLGGRDGSRCVVPGRDGGALGAQDWVSQERERPARLGMDHCEVSRREEIIPGSAWLIAKSSRPLRAQLRFRKAQGHEDRWLPRECEAFCVGHIHNITYYRTTGWPISTIYTLDQGWAFCRRASDAL